MDFKILLYILLNITILSTAYYFIFYLDKKNYVYNDGGRKKYKFNNNVNDCVIRSMAIALKIPYKKVFYEFYDILKRHNQDVNILGKEELCISFMNELMISKGWKYIRVPFWLNKKSLPKGVIICNLNNHVVAVKNKVIHDIWGYENLKNKHVYGYFMKK